MAYLAFTRSVWYPQWSAKRFCLRQGDMWQVQNLWRQIHCWKYWLHVLLLRLCREDGLPRSDISVMCPEAGSSPSLHPMPGCLPQGPAENKQGLGSDFRGSSYEPSSWTACFSICLLNITPPLLNICQGVSVGNWGLWKGRKPAPWLHWERRLKTITTEALSFLLSFRRGLLWVCLAGRLSRINLRMQPPQRAPCNRDSPTSLPVHHLQKQTPVWESCRWGLGGQWTRGMERQRSLL